MEVSEAEYPHLKLTEMAIPSSFYGIARLSWSSHPEANDFPLAKENPDLKLP